MDVAERQVLAARLAVRIEQARRMPPPRALYVCYVDGASGRYTPEMHLVTLPGSPQIVPNPRAGEPAPGTKAQEPPPEVGPATHRFTEKLGRAAEVMRITPLLGSEDAPPAERIPPLSNDH